MPRMASFNDSRCERRMTKSIICLVVFFAVHKVAVASELYIPKLPSQVVAKWEVQKSDASTEVVIAELLREAKYPGNSANYAQAAIHLESLRTQSLNDAQLQVLVLYYDAVIRQHYHHFEKSKQLLDNLLLIQPQNVNAILLKANMHLVLGETDQALQSCTSLLGLAPTKVVAACVIDAKSYKDDLQKSLQQLSTFMRSPKTPKNKALNVSNSPTGSNAYTEADIWFAEIQASMTKDTGDLHQAQAILAPYTAQKVPLSFWVLWSDIQLALNQPENVLTMIGEIVDKTKNKDDSLLLRLAIAEKQLQLTNLQWLPLVSDRIALREERKDTEHAFDIALYYLYIKANPQEAYKWAQINWQQAKLRDDQNLLKLIEKALNQTTVSAKSVGPSSIAQVN